MQSYIDELDTGIFPFVDYEGYDDRYPTLSVQSFPAEFYDEIRHASRMLFQIFYKATKVFQQAHDESYSIFLASKFFYLYYSRFIKRCSAICSNFVPGRP